MANNLSTIDRYGRRSIYDILGLLGSQEYNNKITDQYGETRREYEAVRISEVKISGIPFTNYGQYSFIWEKTFLKEPTRSGAGNLGNLNSYATFLTPHLILDFSLMSIDDYRQIMKLHYESNEYTVECYDPIYNRKIKAKMYFATEEMAKLYTIAQHRLGANGEWEDWVDLVGVADYKVELIGTNNDLDLVSVIYHLNPPANTGYADQTIGEADIYNGEEIVIGGSASSITNETFGGTYVFDHWNISAEQNEENKGIYINGNVYTINQGIVLYAQWKTTTEHILSYNYGLADPAINDSDYQYVTNKKVAYGQSIGNLPSVETPKVKAKDLNGVEKEYTPYYNGQWYKTPIKAQNSVAISNGENYWAHRDSTIYLLYDVSKYNLSLVIDGILYQSNAVEYNSPTNLPQLVKSGYTFDGWYYTREYKDGTKFNGNMPPYNITLYAKWSKQ